MQGKSQKKNQNLSTTKGNTRPINSRTINVVCVCVCVWTHQKIDNDASWNMFFFRSNENKFMCDLQSATIWCEFRSTGFPCTTTHVTQARGGGGGISRSGVLCWWFELTSWPAANLDLMKYERRPAADTNCNSFIKDTLCCCSSQGSGRGGVVALIRVPVSRYNWKILCAGVQQSARPSTKLP